MSSATVGASGPRPLPKSKYSQLLAIIEELGKDIRPTYAGSRSSAERLKRGIVHARILVRECLMETKKCQVLIMKLISLKNISVMLSQILLLDAHFTEEEKECLIWCSKHFVSTL